MTILQISDLSIIYRNKELVRNVNLKLQAGEWHALAGESGSGKSVTASSIGGLLPNGLAISSGNIFFSGEEISAFNEIEMRKKRGREISFIFQDYQGAFTPFIKIGKQFDEMLTTHTNWRSRERKERIFHAFDNVGLPAERTYNSYSFQLSGGQIQRAAIAMGAVLKPKLLIADEPTTALDSVSSKNVLSLIKSLQQEAGCAVLFITHDLRLVKRYGDSVSIMKEGSIVEQGSKKQVLERPKHYYTKQLLASIPPLRNTPKRLKTALMEEETG